MDVLVLLTSVYFWHPTQAWLIPATTKPRRPLAAFGARSTTGPGRVAEWHQGPLDFKGLKGGTAPSLFAEPGTRRLRRAGRHETRGRVHAAALS